MDASTTTQVVSLMSDDLLKVFGDCINGVSADFMKFVIIAIPVGLGIYGFSKAVRLGMNFFNSITN